MPTQQTFICPKSTIETLEYTFEVNYNDIGVFTVNSEHISLLFLLVQIVDFEQIFCWVLLST